MGIIWLFYLFIFYLKLTNSDTIYTLQPKTTIQNTTCHSMSNSYKKCLLKIEKIENACKMSGGTHKVC